MLQLIYILLLFIILSGSTNKIEATAGQAKLSSAADCAKHDAI